MLAGASNGLRPLTAHGLAGIKLALSDGHFVISSRAVVRFPNPGVLPVMWWAYLPPLVGIGLTELPNSGGAKGPPAPPLTTALCFIGVL